MRPHAVTLTCSHALASKQVTNPAGCSVAPRGCREPVLISAAGRADERCISRRSVEVVSVAVDAIVGGAAEVCADAVIRKLHVSPPAHVYDCTCACGLAAGKTICIRQDVSAT